MIDYKLNGVDIVIYNGIRGETNRIDKEFDETLSIITPTLEQKLKPK